MAKVYKCDVCGKQFTIGQQKPEGVEQYYIPSIKRDSGDNPVALIEFVKADVCIQCILKMARCLQKDNVVVPFYEVKTTRKPRKKKQYLEPEKCGVE